MKNERVGEGKIRDMKTMMAINDLITMYLGQMLLIGRFLGKFLRKSYVAYKKPC